MVASRDPDEVSTSEEAASFQLTKFSVALVETTEELLEYSEGDIRMYSIPSLVFSELRAMAEGLAQRTNVRFTKKLYYRLSEVFLGGHFSPERGKHNILQRDLKNEKTNLQSVLQESKALIVKLLGFGNIVGTAHISWDRDMGSLAAYLKGGEFRAAIAQQGRVSSRDIQDSEEELLAIQNKNIFNLYRELVEILKANFLQFNIKGFLQATGSMQNEALLREVTRYILICDILVAYLLQQFAVKNDCILIESLLQGLYKRIELVQAPEVAYQSSLERAVSKVGGGEVPLQLRQRALGKRDVLTGFASSWDRYQKQWESLTVLSLGRAFPNVPQKVLEEATYSVWSWRMISSSQKWVHRMNILGVLDTCGDRTTDMDLVLDVVAATTGVCTLFPEAGDVSGVDDLLESKVRILEPFLQSAMPGNAAASVESSTSRSDTFPQESCPLETINRMFTDIQEQTNKMEKDPTMDVFSLRGLKKKAERLSACCLLYTSPSPRDS